MSGPLSVPFVALALFVPSHVQQVIFGLLAFLCCWFCSYRMWMREHEARLRAESAITELHNPLQIEAFRMARDMRHLVIEAGPIPIYKGPKLREEYARESIQPRSDWRTKLRAAYALHFAAREESLILRFKAQGITMDAIPKKYILLEHSSDNVIENRIEYKAQLFIAMAHCLDR